MKKPLLILLVVLGACALWSVSVYNSLITGRASVDKAWSNVEVQYQRRSDLVPQLVATVQ